ncbi:hypothetical protein KBY75_05940 [Cyanobium sp. T1G-Tous]|uniref:hypothetical protein n=1 Tax=Cyanobium sp. T1G-Tous TaxID=2823722 RepID=UPI0020CC0BD2|nr:hypothetical protein [Cyanobium sp. T1G-Tous]MCP9803105.1 hypothetical protein [Cyanobium sp. T1G-Tous]
MGIQAAPADQAMSKGKAAGVMEHLNWGYIQLGLVALVFGGLQNQGKIGEALRRSVKYPKEGINACKESAMAQECKSAKASKCLK